MIIWLLVIPTQTWEEGEGGVRGRALEVDEPPGRRCALRMPI